MSIPKQPVRYAPSDQQLSSSIVINRGNEKYDPFAPEDDEHGNEQSTVSKRPKEESIRMNNGTSTYPVINKLSNSDKPPSLEIDEQQQSRRKSKSPSEHHSKPSERRSRSPHRNHRSSDCKRLRPSSTEPPTASTVNNNDSISSSRYKNSSRNDDRNHSSSDHRHRLSSLSPSSSSTSNTNNRKKSFNSKTDRSSSSYDSYRSSRRDDYHSYRSNPSRSYHSSSRYSSRDYSSSSPHHGRRTTNVNPSSPARILPSSSTITSDGNSSVHSNESNEQQTSKEDRHRVHNRLKTDNENNTSIASPQNHSNKTSSSGSTFTNSNGGSQRSRSNLIQILTSEATSKSTQVSPIPSSSSQVKLESIKPTSVPSIPAKIESTKIANNFSKSNINDNTADDVLMEEMLLEEEQEQIPVKSIDLDNLTIPEISEEKSDNQDQAIKTISTTSIPTTAIITANTTSIVTTTSLTPSPTKKPYTLYKVPHTNHTTPRLSSRRKKQTANDSIVTQSDKTNKPPVDQSSLRTSLDDRILNLLGAPPTSSLDPQLDIRSLLPTQTSTPSDKSTESPQDIKSLIQTMVKKARDHSSSTIDEQRSILVKQSTPEERRLTTSKHYTTVWLASQKPEEAAAEELTTLPSLVTLPTLVSSQPSTNNTKAPVPDADETATLGKLSEAINKLIQKKTDVTVPTTTEVDDAVPISAKHLERIERKKQREQRQSEIAAIAKEALKPAFKKRKITKEQYKEIMKKVVTKATHANEVDRIRIGKMIDAYVEKYRILRQHTTSKTSTNVNTS